MPRYFLNGTLTHTISGGSSNPNSKTEKQDFLRRVIIIDLMPLVSVSHAKDGGGLFQDTSQN